MCVDVTLQLYQCISASATKDIIQFMQKMLKSFMYVYKSAFVCVCVCVSVCIKHMCLNKCMWSVCVGVSVCLCCCTRVYTVCVSG